MRKTMIAVMSMVFLFCLVLVACDTIENNVNIDDQYKISYYTVTITVDNTDYGTVSKNRVENVAKNTTINVDGNTLTIGETVIIATPSENDEQYTYIFDRFEYSGTKVEGDMTVTAIFSRTLSSDANEQKFRVVFKLKIEGPEGYEFTYNSSTDDVIKLIPYGEKIGDELLEISDEKEIQNQEYQFVGWFYLDINDEEIMVNKDTIMSVENLNIQDNVNELTLYAKIKKLWF